MVQIVHGEPVIDVVLPLLHKGLDLLDGLALPLFLDRQVDQQALPQGGRPAVAHQHLAAGMGVHYLPGGDGGGLIGGGQARGESDAEHVLPLPDQLGHGLGEHRHVDGGGGAQGAAPDAGVKVLGGNVPVVQVVEIFLFLHDEAERKDMQLQLLRHPGGQVAAAVGEDHIIFHTRSPFLKSDITRTGEQVQLFYPIIPYSL